VPASLTAGSPPGFFHAHVGNLLTQLAVGHMGEQVVTLEGWTPIMYWTSDCTTGWVVVYFLLIVFSGSFYVLNLGLAVVSSGLEDSQQHEEDAHAAEDGTPPTSHSHSRREDGSQVSLVNARCCDIVCLR
jgi:hypothetical protein